MKHSKCKNAKVHLLLGQNEFFRDSVKGWVGDGNGMKGKPTKNEKEKKNAIRFSNLYRFR